MTSNSLQKLILIAMANTNTKTNIVERLMSEHVPMLGMPQVIVTRHFCYHWLKARGWNDGRPNSTQRNYEFQSLDYAAFGRTATSLPLTDEAERDRLLALMVQVMERQAA